MSNVNRLKKLLQNYETRKPDDPRPIPDGATPHALPEPAIEMMDTVAALIAVSPGHPSEITEQHTIEMGAMLSEIMVKAALALDIVEKMNRKLRGCDDSK